MRLLLRTTEAPGHHAMMPTSRTLALAAVKAAAAQAPPPPPPKPPRVEPPPPTVPAQRIVGVARRRVSAGMFAAAYQRQTRVGLDREVSSRTQFLTEVADLADAVGVFSPETAVLSAAFRATF